MSAVGEPGVIGWLRRDPRVPPSVIVGGRALPVVVRRLARARRMTLRLAPDGSEARVSLPRWGRSEEAVAFARSRADWLARQLAALPPRAPLRAGSALPYRGAALTIAHDPAASRQPAIAGETIRVGGPAETLAPRLARWLEAEAARLLADDLAQYCARAGVPAPGLALSRARRRWGSCAAPRATGAVVRINWRLVMAPDFVRRSVVAHEVAHLVHFDHSPRFHACLAALFEGDLAAANAWLRREAAGLYAPFG